LLSKGRFAMDTRAAALVYASRRVPMHTPHRLLIAAIALTLVATPALAGPPMICHPFDAGTAPVLPWGKGPNWNNPSATYDTSRLVADTLRLLSPEAPIIARMENMRRAAIYASQDPALSHRLLKAVMDRPLTPHGQRDALAWFDAGYLLETYRRMTPIRKRAGLGAWAATDETLAVDGYGMVKKAMVLVGPNAGMEYAASLIREAHGR
jgi:hypothetical protein